MKVNIELKTKEELSDSAFFELNERIKASTNKNWGINRSGLIVMKNKEAADESFNIFLDEIVGLIKESGFTVVGKAKVVCNSGWYNLFIDKDGYLVCSGLTPNNDDEKRNDILQFA